MVVEPAVGNPTDARFGKRDNAPMWIFVPLSTPILLGFAFYRWRVWIFDLEPKR